MPKRALRPCKQPGCRNLVASGYCEAHKGFETKFNGLRELKSDHHDFYQSNRWKQISMRIRQKEPLCRECKSQGYVTQATLVHHEPELPELLSKGLNPYDEKYLIPICRNCHQRHLNEKKRWK